MYILAIQIVLFLITVGLFIYFKGAEDESNLKRSGETESNLKLAREFEDLLKSTEEISHLYKQEMINLKREVRSEIDRTRNILDYNLKVNKDFYDHLGKLEVKHLKDLQTARSEFKPIETDHVENTIEKQEVEEVALGDTDRIPIVDGVKIKFEDEDNSYPINIK